MGPKAAGEGLGWGGGAKQHGVGGRESLSGVQGRSPGRGLGDERSWRILKVVTSKFYAFFGSISLIFTYICLCSFRACRHHSMSAKWVGAFDTVCPHVCKWGNCALDLPPAPPPMDGTRIIGLYCMLTQALWTYFHVSYRTYAWEISLTLLSCIRVALESRRFICPQYCWICKVSSITDSRNNAVNNTQ